MNIEEILNHSLSYPMYRALIDKLVQEGKTTGINQTEKLLEFTKLNIQRMNRLDKTINLPDDKVVQLKNIDNPVIWLVVGDAWCGDCAQVIPVINKIAEASGGKIDLRIVSRDSYPEFTEFYKAMSIPKLLVIDAETKEVIGSWGPRPQPARDIMLKWKASEGKISKEDFEKELHLWYSKDKGVTIIDELVTLLNSMRISPDNRRMAV